MSSKTTSAPRADHILVSVVTPSLNQAAYLEQTILSVRNQRYPRIEHIIVDGGSTDGTLDILRRHESTYDMRWVSEPDSGMYDAINRGFRMSKGEVMAYLNSDDLYFPWTIAVAVRALQENPGAGFVFGDMLNVDEVTGLGTIVLYPPFRLGSLRRSGFLGQPTVFWRRSIGAEVGAFDASLKFVADCDYWMRMGEHARAVKVPEMMAVERNHPDAKRFAARAALLQELESVRSRYVSTVGWRFRLRWIADRIRASLWRRYQLMRFLYVSLLSVRSKRSRPWGNFLSADSGFQVFRARALLTLLPFGAKAVGRGVVRPEQVLSESPFSTPPQGPSPNG